MRWEYPCNDIYANNVDEINERTPIQTNTHSYKNNGNNIDVDPNLIN